MATNLPLQPGLEPYPGYHLTLLLGRGFGEVWEAETATGEKLALKFLPLLNDATAPAELRSLQRARQVYHPGLVPIHQVWCYQHFIVLAMERAEGSLKDLLEAYQEEFGTPIQGDQVCQYLHQVATALDFLNTRQHTIDGAMMTIQHCDIKPSNMLLFGDTIKVCDLGQMTAPGSFMPTRRPAVLAFVAPELLLGRPSERSDQFSLAVSYCELRGGRLPFPEDPGASRRGYHRPAPDLTMLPPPEGGVIARALANLPQDRWPTCGRLMAELSAVVQ